MIRDKLKRGLSDTRLSAEESVAITIPKVLITMRASLVVQSILTAMIFTLTACASSSHDAGSTVPKPTSGVTSPAATTGSTNRGRDDHLALQLLDAIIRGDFSAVTAQFDSTMRQKLTAQQLGSAWAEYQQDLGNYQSHGDPQDVPRAPLTVVNVPLQMCREPGQFRVTFHNDGTVAGLYFLRAGVSVP